MPILVRLGLPKPEVRIGVKATPAPCGITSRRDEPVVGAMTTYRELTTDELVAWCLPLLCSSERHVGKAGVRSRGLFGGNLCCAKSRSDVTTVRSSLGVRAVLVSTTGRRELPVTDFVLGGCETTLEPVELLAVVVIAGLDCASGVHPRLPHSERPVLSLVPLRDRADGFCASVVGGPGAPRAISPADLAMAVDALADLANLGEHKRYLAAVLVCCSFMGEVKAGVFAEKATRASDLRHCRDANSLSASSSLVPRSGVRSLRR